MIVIKSPKGYNAILSKQKNLAIKVGVPTKQKVRLGKNDPPIWGCKGNDLKRITIPISGSLDDLTQLLALKTIEGVYMQLLLQKA